MTNDNVLAERHTPPITLSFDDYERLSALVHAARTRMPDLADDLAEELGRAHVLHKGKHPQDVVAMKSEVKFRDETSGKIHEITLVYPEAADISHHKVSVLTPVGTALIGLGTGRSISWKTPTGEVRQLTVLAVREPVVA